MREIEKKRKEMERQGVVERERKTEGLTERWKERKRERDKQRDGQ